MVRFYLIVILFLVCFFVNGQTQDSVFDKNLIVYLDQPPIYKGDLISFIKKNIKYPQNKMDSSIEGKVFVSCWVDTNGVTIQHKIIRGLNKDLDSEAIRVVRLIKFNKPAMQNGKPIKVEYIIPVEFIHKNKSKQQK